MPIDNWPDPEHKPTDAKLQQVEDIVGRGKGDPDVYGYPGEKPTNIKYVGQDKPKIEYHDDANEINGQTLPF